MQIDGDNDDAQIQKKLCELFNNVFYDGNDGKESSHKLWPFFNLHFWAPFQE